MEVRKAATGTGRGRVNLGALVERAGFIGDTRYVCKRKMQIALLFFGSRNKPLNYQKDPGWCDSRASAEKLRIGSKSTPPRSKFVRKNRARSMRCPIRTDFRSGLV